jgi:chromosome segregation ATPase
MNTSIPNTVVSHILMAFAVVLFLSAQMLSAAESRAPSANNNAANNAALMQAQRQVQEATAEREKLVQQVAELEKKLKASEAGRDKAEKQLHAKESSLDKFKDSNSGMADMLKTMKTRMEELIGKYREVTQQLKDTEQGKAEAESTLAQKDAELKRHVENNLKLYAVSLDVLEKYEDKGVWDALFQQEPVTQIKRAEIESIAEDYRIELEKLKAQDAVQVVGR